MRVLISLCNEERDPERGLLLYDVARAEGRWIPVGTAERIMGTRGICVRGTTLYALYTVGWHETRIVSYDLRGPIPTPITDTRLAEVTDPHSLCVFRDRLLVASTGTDEIIAYDLVGDAPDEFGETFWRASGEGADVHHVNGVCADDERVLVSAFGPRSGEFWSSAENGYVEDALAGTFAFRGIYHPHSPRIFAGVPYVLESSRQRLRRKGDEAVTIGGYVRGLDRACDGTLAIGTNAARRVSRSRGVVTNSTNPENADGEPVGSASLVLLAPDGAERTVVDLDAFGREVYDVLVLPEPHST